MTRLGLRLSITMLNDYLSKLVKLPMSFYAKKVNSDLIQKAEDHSRIKNFLLSVPNSLFFALIAILVFSTLLVIFSPLIFFIFLFFTALSLVWTTIFLRYRRELDSSLVAKSSENRNNLYELIEGIEEIKSNNAHITRLKIWKELQEKINKLSIKSTLLKVYQAGGNTFFVRLRDIIIMGICACLVIESNMTIGIMMTVSYIVGRLSIPFNSLFDSINAVQDSAMSYNRIEEIHSIDILEPKFDDKLQFSSIDFNNVSFKYPGSGCPMVLSNLNFAIPKGKVTALVGSSGSGKSTIIKLISAFFVPTEGNVKLSEYNISDIPDSVLSRHIAVVLQNGKIFSGTILSNIALSDENPDIERANEAARIACIDEYINGLPMGIHSRIGKTGLDLSGGQQQRILIARAVYRNPNILILDEATSSMDAITESKIMHNIYEKFEGKTLVIAAHRLSTIRNADNIFVIDNGQVVESGRHEELLCNKGEYFQLVNKQI